MYYSVYNISVMLYVFILLLTFSIDTAQLVNEEQHSKPTWVVCLLDSFILHRILVYLCVCVCVSD